MREREGYPRNGLIVWWTPDFDDGVEDRGLYLETSWWGCGYLRAKVGNVAFNRDVHVSLTDETIKLCKVFSECY
jgi:hypothetical protein